MFPWKSKGFLGDHKTNVPFFLDCKINHEIKTDYTICIYIYNIHDLILFKKNCQFRYQYLKFPQQSCSTWLYLWFYTELGLKLNIGFFGGFLPANMCTCKKLPLLKNGVAVSIKKKVFIILIPFFFLIQ